MLGRNLEALVTRAQDFKTSWKDKFVSVEHLILAMLDDTRFGKRTLEKEGLTKSRLEQAIKDIRGSNQVTDQACSHHPANHPSISDHVHGPELLSYTADLRESGCLSSNTFYISSNILMSSTTNLPLAKADLSFK